MMGFRMSEFNDLSVFSQVLKMLIYFDTEIGNLRIQKGENYSNRGGV